MFGFFQPKKSDVISHWYSLLPAFNVSTAEFYEAIEKELKAREVPNLEMERVDFAEGGLLSANRVYLRMKREMLVFDVCASPFGTGYFFSCRFAELPVQVKLWHLLVAFFAVSLLLSLLIYFFGRWIGIFLFLLFGFGLVYVLRNSIALGLRDLDATLMKLPVIGPIYIRFFRKETYYRQDTRLMYCDLVNDVVKTKVQEATGMKGIQLLRYNEHNPLLEELYKPRFVRIGEAPSV